MKISPATFLSLSFVFCLVAARALAATGDYPMQAQAVAPNVYAVVSPARDFPSPANRGWNSNSAFVVTRTGVLVFDTGSSEAIGAALKRAIRRVTDKPVRWIVNSHAHGDHWLGNAALVEDGTEIIASGETASLIRSQGASWVERINRMTDGATGASSIRVPTTVVTAPVTRDFGGVEVRFLLPHDAHSPGDLLAWLPGPRVLLAGDVVYSDRMPAVVDGKVRAWTAFLPKLAELHPRVIVPGHGIVADARVLEVQERFLSELWNDVQHGYDQGKADFEILPAVRKHLLPFRRDYADFDAHIGGNVSQVYLQVEAASF